MNDHYPFTLKPLPYSYHTLEPHIDAKTVQLHHDKHMQAYVDGLNQTLKNYPEYQDWGLKALIANVNLFPEPVKTGLTHNAGGVFNHELYFDSMGEKRSTRPTGSLSNAIDHNFQSFDNFKKLFKDASLSQFGSGWVWLVYDSRCVLQIMRTDNQNTPPLSVWTPLLNIDVWEHAYYLQYQNRRAEYVDNWFELVDWEKVSIEFPCG